VYLCCGLYAGRDRERGLAGGGDEAVDLCCLEIACRLMQTGSAILQAGYGRRCLVILQYSHSQNVALRVHSTREISCFRAVSCVVITMQDLFIYSLFI
jgi:hypothetical protein